MKRSKRRRLVSILVIAAMMVQSILIDGSVFAAGNLELQIEGYQINTAMGAHRTIYSVDGDANDIAEAGLIYGLRDKVSDADMVINSSNGIVHSYKATSVGKLKTEGNKNYYAMTMQFIDNAEYYATTICERAYVKKTDGSYVYSNIETMSVVNVADVLYQGSLMKNETSHNYLFDNILSKTYDGYRRVNYNPGQTEIETTQKQTEPQTTTEAPTTKVEETTRPPIQEEETTKPPTNISLTPYYDGLDSASCSEKGSGNETIDKLFDNNADTKFFSWNSDIRIAWKMSQAVIARTYSFTTGNDTEQYHRNPTKWQFYGSNDATTWIQLHAVDGNSGMEDKNKTTYTFTPSVQDSYQYYMVHIEGLTYVNGATYGFQLAEISINGDVAPATTTLGGSLNYFDSIYTPENTVNGYGSEKPENLFDGDTSTKLFNVGAGSIAWKMKTETTLYSYTLTTANDNVQYTGRNPRSWLLYGSNNGTDWTKIDAVANSGIEDKNYTSYTYTVNHVSKFLYYKLDIATLDSGAFQLSEITLNGAAVSPSEYDIMFYKDWDKITNKGYVNELVKLFYNSYPRLYKRWGTGTEPKTITFMADKDYDGVAYCAGTTVCVSTDYANGHPTDIGFFSHEITHSVQQYGGKLNYGGDLYWWTENMANYGGFRYFHWSNPKYVQVYEANDTSLQDWGYHPYGNNKWFFAYMDSRYPTTRDSNGNKKLGLIDSINKLIKDNNTGSEYSDNPYTVGSPINNKVKEITGYNCFEDLRKHYVDELKNGTWTFNGFGDYTDNWLTENIEGIANPEYPMRGEKTHGNTTAKKLDTAVTSGTNLCNGASVYDCSGYTNNNESGAKLIDGNLGTKWCATSSSVTNPTYSLNGVKHWIMLDLGSEKTFNTYTLYNTRSAEGYGNATEWEVLVSNDAKNWTSVDYRGNDNSNIASYDIGLQKARYVFIKVFTPDDGVGTLRLYEFQLYNR